jgi:hypothetical protein
MESNPNLAHTQKEVKNKGDMPKTRTVNWTEQPGINTKVSNANTRPKDACSHLHKTVLFVVSKGDLLVSNCGFNIQGCLI